MDDQITPGDQIAVQITAVTKMEVKFGRDQNGGQIRTAIWLPGFGGYLGG